MEKLAYTRGSVLFGYGDNNNNVISCSSSSSRRDSDIDFSDVFGGPPRRSSVHEGRHSFNGARAIDHEEDEYEEDDDNDGDEKPVFGDAEGGGIIARRRYPNNMDFFDDIFKGKELYSLSCSPRMKQERDGSLSSASGSRVSSPVRPLPPRADQQQLLNGGSSSPAQFSLPSRQINGTELATFGSPTRNQHKNKDIGSNGSSNYSHSPLSRPSNSNRAQEVLESNVRLRAYLSKELSLTSENLLDLEKAEAKETNKKLEKQSLATDSDGSQAQGNGGQFHFNIYKWASKGSPLDVPLRAGKVIGSKEKVKVPRSSSFNGCLNGDEMAKRSPRVTPDHQSSDKQKDDLSAHTSIAGRVEQVSGVEGARKPGSSRSHQVTDTKHAKEEHGKNVNADNGDVENAYARGSERRLRSSISKNKGGGKVKEFVKIFNQEPAGKPEVNVESQRQNSWRKESGKQMIPDATSAKSTGIERELNSQRKDKHVDASILVDENHRRSEKHEPGMKPNSTNSVNTKATSLGSAPDVSESITEELDDSFHDNFVIEEILQDDRKPAEENTAKSEAEEVKDMDDKIRSWSRGKEGNIRSLLSTLQYVLWPGSGWKTVPLVDIVEGNAVRKPYQKALLCLHPDKLQQKGATSHQKYMAEKVFDILQEAWTQFNSLG